MKTTIIKENEIKRKWLLVDAAGKPLGRLAVKVADLIRGRNSPAYTPHVDAGDFVVVINARKVRLTGQKETRKIYLDYSGYRGGLKKTPAARMRERHPEQMILRAVRGMLPKNRMMRAGFKRLKVYAGGEHPHAAQNPVPVEI